MPLAAIVLLFATAGARADEGAAPLDDLVTRIGPSIVRLGMFDGDDMLGNGTGFFVREDGILVTNHHVVEDVRGELLAVMADGTRHRVAGSLALDKEHDIALVKVEGSGFRPIPLAEPGSFRVGDPVYLIGSSHGLDQSLGVGVISAIRDEFPEEWKKRAEKSGRSITKGPIVQHTANSAPGSSGSPVVDAAGRVVGVHHSGLIDSPIYFGAHVDVLRALLEKTNLEAEPAPLGPKRMQNLIISGVFFAAIAIGFAVARFRRQRPRRQVV